VIVKGETGLRLNKGLYLMLGWLVNQISDYIPLGWLKHQM